MNRLSRLQHKADGSEGKIGPENGGYMIQRYVMRYCL